MISKWYFAYGVFAVMLILIIVPYGFYVSQIVREASGVTWQRNDGR